MKLVRSRGPKETSQALHRMLSKLPNRLDPLTFKDLPALGSHSPQGANWKSVKEFNGGLGGDQQKTVRLRIRGGNFGHRLCRGDPHRRRQAEVPSNLSTNIPRDLSGGSETEPRPLDVNKSLVNAHLLNKWAKTPDDLHDFTRIHAVELEVPRNEYCCRTQRACTSNRHAGTHTQTPGLVGRRSDNPSIPTSPHDDGLTDKRWVLTNLNLREERIHVNVQDIRLRIIVSPKAFATLIARSVRHRIPLPA